MITRKRQRTARCRERSTTVRLSARGRGSLTHRIGVRCLQIFVGDAPRPAARAHFPPLGGAGVHRTVGTVRHLAEHGYEVVLVTGPGQPRSRWDAPDTELMARIPAGAEVRRVEAPSRRAHRVRGAAVAPDRGLTAGCAGGSSGRCGSAARWRGGGRRARPARRTRRRTPASGWPPSSVCRGWRTSRTRGRSTRCGCTRRRLTGRSTCAQCDAALVERGGDRHVGARGRGARAPGGAGRSASRRHPDRLRRDDSRPGRARRPHLPHRARRLAAHGRRHAGAAHAARRRLLGGYEPGVDISPARTCSCSTRSSAAGGRAGARRQGRAPPRGRPHQEDRAVADRHDFVHTPGLLAHREAVALMRSADVLFLPMHDLPPGTRAGLIPYKTYEYLGARRPILAAVPGRRRARHARPARGRHPRAPEDVERMAGALRTEIACAPQPTVVRKGIGSLERGRSVAQIAAVLDAGPGPLRRGAPAGCLT